jgi:glutamate-1-semialdehyde 2,1-aminomutase
LSIDLWNEAQQLFAGGVNSPVRALVKPYPFYTSKGEGPFLITEDGKKIVDYVLGYGPLILGHSPEKVRSKIMEQVEKGWLYGTPSRIEVELAKKIIFHIPSAQKIRFVNSGTEATMNAIRLVRGFTGREKIIKFNGNYHGAHDYGLIEAGSAVSEYGITISKGIPKDIVKTVLLCEYNDLTCVEKYLKEENVAGVIMEPVMGNYGVIPPKTDFIKGIRELTSAFGTLLIFDEVITGFRLGLSGAQGMFGVVPDVTTLGKIIGGGLPIGAIAGRREIMDSITPAGEVFNAGTFNANPLSMAAGLATIEELEHTNAYEISNEAAKVISQEVDQMMKIDHVTHRVGSMMQFFLGVKEVKNATEAKKANKSLYLNLHEQLLKEGVFIPPSQLETIFTSASHSQNVINFTIDKFRKVLREIKNDKGSS